MDIEVEGLSKEYNYSTVFSGFSAHFKSGERIAVLGSNGSGKSTLLKVLSGMVEHTSGSIKWSGGEKEVKRYNWFRYFSFCSPQLFFDEQFSVSEVIEFFTSFRSHFTLETVDDFIGKLDFQSHKEKKVSSLSSGMYQRLRLLLTISMDVPVLFLDEPCSNLDKAGVEWYRQLVDEFGREKLILVASNDEREYAFCREQIYIPDYK